MNKHPLITLKNLTKTYRMGDEVVTALNFINLTISQKQFVAITGPSGSGKSTLMHILGCLDRPTSGNYILANNDIAQVNLNEQAEIRNKMIGFVFQRFNLLAQLTAQENVALPLRYAGVSTKSAQQQAVQLLTQMELDHRMSHYPHQLSGGQQQRVAIARALITRPKILLADEPTGNLDSKTAHIISEMELFHELHAQEDITIILVTHEPAIAKQAGRIIQLIDGSIVLDSSK